jgi:hypothetical protein
MKTQVATCALLTAVAVVGLGMTPALAVGELSDRTVIVSPTEFNSWRGNCTNLRAALDGITDASGNKPYTVLVEPSIYRCDDNPVNIPAWVSVEALGKGVVEIRSTVDSGDLGAVNMESNSSIVGLSILNSDGNAAESAYAIAVGTDETPATNVLIKHSTAKSNNGSAVAVLPCSSLTVKGATLDGAFEALFTEGGDCEDHADVYVSHSWLIGGLDGTVVFLGANTTGNFIDNGFTGTTTELVVEGSGASALCTSGNYDHDTLEENDFAPFCEV